MNTVKERKGCDYFAREIGRPIAKTIYEVLVRVEKYGVAFRRRESIRQSLAGTPRTRHATERGVNRPLVAIISHQGLSDRVRKYSVKLCILLVREIKELKHSG